MSLVLGHNRFDTVRLEESTMSRAPAVVGGRLTRRPQVSRVLLHCWETTTTAFVRVFVRVDESSYGDVCRGVVLCMPTPPADAMPSLLSRIIGNNGLRWCT